MKLMEDDEEMLVNQRMDIKIRAVARRWGGGQATPGADPGGAFWV